jgi:hypothetical protein
MGAFAAMYQLVGSLPQGAAVTHAFAARTAYLCDECVLNQLGTATTGRLGWPD